MAAELSHDGSSHPELDWLGNIAREANADAVDIRPPKAPEDAGIEGYEDFLRFLNSNSENTFFVLAEQNKEMKMNFSEMEEFVRTILKGIARSQDVTACTFEFTQTSNQHFDFRIQKKDGTVLSFQSVRLEKDPKVIERELRQQNEKVIQDVTQLLTTQLSKYGELFVPDTHTTLHSEVDIRSAVQGFLQSKSDGEDLFQNTVSYTLNPLSGRMSSDSVDEENPLYAVCISLSSEPSLWILPSTHELSEDKREFMFSGTQAKELLELIHLWPDTLSDAFPEKILLHKLKKGFTDFPWDQLENISFVQFDARNKTLYISGINGKSGDEGVSVYHDAGSSVESHADGEWINTLCLLLLNGEKVLGLLQDDTLANARAKRDLLQTPAYNQQDHHLFAIPESLGIPESAEKLQDAVVTEMVRRYRIRLNAILDEILADGKGDVLGAIVDAYRAVSTEFKNLSNQGIPLDEKEPTEGEPPVRLERTREKFYSALGILDDEELQKIAAVQNGISLEQTWTKIAAKVEVSLQDHMRKDIQKQFEGEAQSLLGTISEETKQKISAELVRITPKKKMMTYMVNGRPVTEEEYNTKSTSIWVQIGLRPPDKKEMVEQEVPQTEINVEEVYTLCKNFLGLPSPVRLTDRELVERKLAAYDTAFAVGADLESKAKLNRQFAEFAARMPDIHTIHALPDNFPVQFCRQGGFGAENTATELLGASDDELNVLAAYLEKELTDEAGKAFLQSNLFLEIKNADAEAIGRLYAKANETSTPVDASQTRFIDFLRANPRVHEEIILLRNAEYDTKSPELIRNLHKDARDKRRAELKSQFLAFAKKHYDATLDAIRGELQPLAATLQSYFEQSGISSEDAAKMVADKQLIAKLVSSTAIECISDFSKIAELHRDILARLQPLKLHVQIPFTEPRRVPTTPGLSAQQQQRVNAAYDYLIR